MQQLTNLHFQRLFESAPGLYLILQPDLTIVGVSDAYLKATMTQRKIIIDQGLFEVFPDNPDDLEATGTTNLRLSLETVLKTGMPHRMAIQKYPIRRPDGSFEERYWSPLNSPVFDDEKKLLLIIHNVVDVTEIELLKLEEEKRVIAYDNKLKELNEQLKQELKEKTAMIMDSNEQLHLLAAHLQNIRELEQKRIAREIHDELGQQITGLKMDVAWMKKKVNGHDTVGFLYEKLDQMTELLDMSVQTVRKISLSLRPSVLDDLGLVAALEWQTREFEKRFGIQTRFTSSQSSVDMQPDISTGLFRLYQESLTNVARHAQASQVVGTLECNDQHIILIISDNGKGFDQELDGNRKTMGLLGMKERVLMMGGTLNITSAPGKGTTVTASIPLEKAQIGNGE